VVHTSILPSPNRPWSAKWRQRGRDSTQLPLRPSNTAAGLLLATLSRGWRVAIHKPPPPPDMARSPLQPLLMVAAREAGLVAGGAAPPVDLRFSPAAGGPDAEQLAGAREVGSNARVLSHPG
jgi:hypothetical protein